MAWNPRLRKRLKELGWSTAELTRRMGYGDDKSVRQRVYKYVQDKVKSPRGEMLAELADAVGLTEEQLRFGSDGGAAQFPIIGYAGAGERWTPAEDAADLVDLRIGDDEAIGIRVRGDSMSPVYRDRDVLIGSRAHGAEMRAALNHDCIIQTVTGDRFVKVLLKGSAPARFRLRSYNPAYPDIEDVMLDWAARIEIIRRA